MGIFEPRTITSYLVSLIFHFIMIVSSDNEHTLPSLICDKMQVDERSHRQSRTRISYGLSSCCSPIVCSIMSGSISVLQLNKTRIFVLFLFSYLFGCSRFYSHQFVVARLSSLLNLTSVPFSCL